ncbi:hypothetical protein ACVRXT_07495 [Streptococcus lutetiensis]|uniref:Phage protein n=1 Tax=Streptococcus lutetiensis TaxID=150055 RepID=A0AB38G4Z0_9STRE|nr:hypothetical protein [Streptococcus lutetiensis]QQE30805.1 hypothetical protein I6H75_00290 [Streptococcus lutetiensis]SQF42015.1 phage protein [Streptococcus lutetiensis]
MELFSLFGKIGIKNQEANKAIDETTGKAEGAHGKIGKAFSGVGNLAVKAGKAIGVGLAAGAAAFSAVSVAAVKNYAEYEQLVGGVETLFGTGGKSLEEYAQSVGKSVEDASEEFNKLQSAQGAVMEHSRNSFKETGLSANAYMETITSFSASLIQSLGGDTQKAAEVGHKAVVDMSDNANKMGTNIQDIQNAYQGFAKQNYTMLDNLKLGFGGTKEEMQRLLKEAEKISGIHYNIDSFADVVEAIHVMQESMGIAGTTAKEAEKTISGSIGMMKAAWTDLLTGMADSDQDIAKLVNNVTYSFGRVLDNIIPRIQEALPRVIEGLTQVLLQLSAYLPGLLQTILPALIDGATQLLGALFSILPMIFNILFNTILPEVSDNFIAFLDKIFSQVPPEFSGLQTAYENIKQIILEVASMVGEFFSSFSGADDSKGKVDGLKDAIKGVSDFLADATGGVKDFVTWFKQGGTSVDVFKSAIVGATGAWTAYKVVTSVIKGVETARNVILGVSNGLMLAHMVRTKALTAAEGAHAAATVAGTGAVKAFNAAMAINPWGILIAAIAAAVAGLVWFFSQTETGKKMWSDFTKWLGETWQSLVNGAGQIWQGLVDFFSNLWTSIKDTASSAWEGVKSALTSAWSSIVSAAQAVWNGLVAFFNVLWGSIAIIFQVAWLAIYTPLRTAWEVFWAFTQGFWQGLAYFFSDLWEGIKSVATSVWDAISSALTAVWNTIVAFAMSVWQGFVLTLTTIWNGILAVATPIFNALSTFFSTLWNGIVTVAMTIWSILVTGLTNMWNSAVTVATTVWTALSAFFSSLWSGISSTASSVWSSISSFLSGVWNGISSTASSVFNGIKNTVSNAFNGIRGVASSVWNGVKSTISNAINGARDAVRNAIEAIKGFFNFSISWPHIPMPHFSISPAGWSVGDLLKGKIPHLGVQFYKKGGIMTSPTLFGMNGNNAMVGGEAGDEAVLPLNDKTLAGIGKGIVDATGGESESVEVLHLILGVLEEILDKDLDVYLDSDTLVGKTYRKYQAKITASDARNLRLRGG